MKFPNKYFSRFFHRYRAYWETFVWLAQMGSYCRCKSIQFKSKKDQNRHFPCIIISKINKQTMISTFQANNLQNDTLTVSCLSLAREIKSAQTFSSEPTWRDDKVMRMRWVLVSTTSFLAELIFSRCLDFSYTSRWLRDRRAHWNHEVCSKITSDLAANRDFLSLWRIYTPPTAVVTHPSARRQYRGENRSHRLANRCVPANPVPPRSAQLWL